MSVCGHWKDVTLYSPSLWSTLSLAPPATISHKTLTPWETEAARACAYPLSVRLDWGSRKFPLSQHPGAIWLNKYSNQCRVMKLKCQTPPGDTIPLFSNEAKLHGLELLELSIYPGDRSEGYNPTNAVVDLSTADNLRCLMIKLNPENNSWYVPYAIIWCPPVANTTRLYVEQLNSENLAHVLNVIGNVLEELAWVDEETYYNYETFNKSEIHLPKLRAFRLQGDMLCRCIGTLNAPLLEELILIDHSESFGPLGASDLRYVFRNVRILHYELHRSHMAILSILPLCPNAAVLYIAAMDPFLPQGVHGQASEVEPSSELFLTLSSSSSAKQPLPHLR